MKMPYYIGDRKGDPNLENYPCGTLPEAVLKVPFKEGFNLGFGA